MAREFPEELLGDIDVLIAHADRLDAIKNFSNYAGVGIYGLGRRMAGVLGLKPNEARELLFSVSRLCQFRDAVENDSSQFVEALTDRLEKLAPEEWRTKHLQAWKDRSKEFSELFTCVGDDHPLMIARKAHELAYSHQNIFVEGRLITDVRPVFDSKGEIIHDFVVTHMFSIEYTDGSQKQTTLTLAMDALDLEKLQDQCERAGRKVLTLQKALSDFNTIVMPDLDEKDGSG